MREEKFDVMKVGQVQLREGRQNRSSILEGAQHGNDEDGEGAV